MYSKAEKVIYTATISLGSPMKIYYQTVFSILEEFPLLPIHVHKATPTVFNIS